MERLLFFLQIYMGHARGAENNPTPPFFCSHFPGINSIDMGPFSNILLACSGPKIIRTIPLVYSSTQIRKSKTKQYLCDEVLNFSSFIFNSYRHNICSKPNLARGVQGYQGAIWRFQSIIQNSNLVDQHRNLFTFIQIECDSCAHLFFYGGIPISIL